MIHYSEESYREDGMLFMYERHMYSLKRKSEGIRLSRFRDSFEGWVDVTDNSAFKEIKEQAMAKWARRKMKV